MAEKLIELGIQEILSAEDLISGSQIIHDIDIPPEVLSPQAGSTRSKQALRGKVRLQPLNISTLTAISKAARQDAGLIPVLMISQSFVEPKVTPDQARQMHIGLVHFLVERINQISGLAPDGDTLDRAMNSPQTSAHILLAKHFGWTPEQVSQLTPGQIAVYLAGVEKLLAYEEHEKSHERG